MWLDLLLQNRPFATLVVQRIPLYVVPLQVDAKLIYPFIGLRGSTCVTLMYQFVDFSYGR